MQRRESGEEKRKKNCRRWRSTRRWRKRKEVVENAARRAGGGIGRRGVVLTRTGAFLIIICLSLGISREERGRPRGERRRRGGGNGRVPWKKRGRLEEKEGAGAHGKERKRRSGAPKRVAAKHERKGARRRERDES